VTALTDISDCINRETGGSSGAPETIWWHKQARVAGAAPTAPIAGRPMSLWRFDGQPALGAVPGAVAIPDNTTDGGLKQTDPAGGTQKWMLGGGVSGLVAGTVILYDRLLHIGGLSGTTTTAQTVGGTITRYTNGAGNMLFAEVYTTVGASSTTISASYTDQDGNTGQTTAAVAFGNTGFREDTRAIFLPLASGDTGVRACASTTVLATTGTAGSFGITMAHPLAMAAISAAGLTGWRNFTTGMPGLPEVLTDACLALLFIPNTTTIPELFGAFNWVER